MLTATRWRASRLLILGYHGVSLADEHLWHPGLYLSQEDFHKRMRLLAKGGYNVLPLGKALDLLAANSLPPRAVVITVDDGLYDFYAAAWPILKEFDFPATVYQTTYYCTHRYPVFDLIVSYILWKGRNGTIDGERFTGQWGALDLGTFESRQQVIGRIRSFVVGRGYTAEEKDVLARVLARGLDVDYEAILGSKIGLLMSPEQVSEIVAAGIDVQLHTHRHRTPSDASLFRREIEDNRRELLAMGVSSADHFCYPSGIHRPAFLPWLREANVKSATTCEAGFTTAESDPLLLPRLMDTSQLSLIEFESWLTGLGAMLPTRSYHQEMVLY